MIGKIYTAEIEYYDTRAGSYSRKYRPVLIISMPLGLDNDFTVLPVSTISRADMRDAKFDYFIEHSKYSKLTFSKDCYIRTHKQTQVHRKDLNANRCIGDLKNDYPNVFLDIMSKREEYNNMITDNAFL